MRGGILGVAEAAVRGEYLEGVGVWPQGLGELGGDVCAKLLLVDVVAENEGFGGEGGT